MKTAETMTDSEIREELAAEGVDLDAAKSRFMPKLDEMMQARAVRLALAALKANPPHEQSPLPWYGCQFTGVLRDGDSNELADSLTVNDSLHIAAAVNAAPHLLAEVDALRAQLEALASLIKRWPTCPHWHDCATLNRGGDCTCGAVEADLARAEARKLLGVEDA